MPASADGFAATPVETSKFQPPENPTLWQRLLLFLHGLLLGLVKIVERLLAP